MAVEGWGEKEICIKGAVDSQGGGGGGGGEVRGIFCGNFHSIFIKAL